MSEMQLMVELGKSCLSQYFNGNYFYELLFLSEVVLDCRIVESFGLLLRAGIIRYEISAVFVYIC